MGYTKLVQTGGVIEVYEYEKEPSVLLHTNNLRRAKLGISLPRRVQKRRGDNIDRARKSFRRLVRGNLSKGSPALLTLTMLDILGIKDAYRCYTSFGQRLRRTYGSSLAWLAVPEFQARGAVHFHVLMWGLPDEILYTERINRTVAGLWGHGFVDLVPTNGDMRLATYLSKYMTKALSDDRLIGVKGYTASRNVIRSVSINKPSAIDFLTEHFKLGIGDNLPVHEHTYGTLWLGRCNYKRFELKDVVV